MIVSHIVRIKSETLVYLLVIIFIVKQWFTDQVDTCFSDKSLYSGIFYFECLFI